MGEFGAEHRDKKDNRAYYTSMTSVSDLPEGYDQGRFFILYPGVFTTLSNFATMHFSGLRVHGGTAPIAPPDADPDDFQSAVRFNVIYYPPRGQTMGNQRYTLGGLPNNEPFFISPEMTSAKYLHNSILSYHMLISTPARPIEREKRGWCVRAAYLEDGHVVSARRAHVNFVIRAFYSLILYFILQLPEAYGVRVDLNTFFAAFSMLNEQNERERVQPWHAAPGFRYEGDETLTMDTSADGRPMQPSREILDDSRFRDQEDIREPLRAKWDRYYHHVASHIPYGADKLCLDVPDDDETSVESTLNLKTQTSIPRTPNIPPQATAGGRPERMSIHLHSLLLMYLCSVMLCIDIGRGRNSNRRNGREGNTGAFCH